MSVVVLAVKSVKRKAARVNITMPPPTGTPCGEHDAFPRECDPCNLECSIRLNFLVIPKMGILEPYNFR